MNVKLMKYHPSVQLAHLYEHLFCTQIKSYLYAHGLFKYTDFALEGSTFEQAGLIEIDLDLYTKSAEQLYEDIKTLPIDYNTTSIETALLQIRAEEASPLHVESIDVLRQLLQELHATPWIPIEELTFLDAKTVRRQAGAIYLTDDTVPKPHKIVTTLSLDDTFSKHHRDLVPLFRHVAKFIMFTTQDQISQAAGLYCGEMSYRNSTLKADLLIHHTNASQLTANDIVKRHESVVQYMAKHHGPQRLLEWLTTASYLSRPANAPNTYDAFLETGIYVGLSGWQDIATSDNLALVWDNITLSVKYGSQRAATALPDLQK